MIETLKKLSPYKADADRAPSRPMGRWTRRILGLIAAAAFAWPLMGLMVLRTGGGLPDQRLEAMLACALASALLVTLLKIDLVGRIEHRARKTRKKAEG